VETELPHHITTPIIAPHLMGQRAFCGILNNKKKKERGGGGGGGYYGLSTAKGQWYEEEDAS